MKLNFYLEGAGLIIGIILCCATSVRYNIIDLKDKIYVHMVRMITVLQALNMVAYFIIRKNLSGLMAVAEIVICISFLLIVWIWFYLNNYLLEVVYNKNYFPIRMYLIIGMPAFLNLLLILANWGTHKVFDVGRVEGGIQVVFNSWYKLPYILAAFSLLLYLAIMLKNQYKLRKNKQYVFFIIPFVMLAAYYFQYRYKSIAVLGFGYIIVLMLLYIYIYNRIVKIDNLTQLPDGDAFKKMLDYRIGLEQNMTIAMIALDDFKRVNYEYGYHNGSKFIALIANYLEGHSPRKCVSRYGGDKFAVIFENPAEEEVRNWSKKILERFKHSWQIGKLSHRLSVCITLVDYPELAKDSAEILALLEYLNTYAKKHKKNQCILCDDVFKERMKRRIAITSILNDVIQEKKVYVEYQPILDMEKNAYTRAEAVFRLRDDELGEIPLQEFLPIAEENGYVIEMGYVLIHEICKYIVSLKEENALSPIISVDFSRQQIMAEDMIDRVIGILHDYQLEPDCMAIELSEDVFSVQFDSVKSRIMQMHELGFRFYLDGFGTGFLDISQLIELPFEIVKINGKLFKEAEKKDSIYLLVSALIAVFEESGKKILGEGIESEYLREIADLLFMDYLQGDYYCKCISEADARKEFERQAAACKE